MPTKHPLMRLSHEEASFLRHGMDDESHYQDGLGLAKRLQLHHEALPVQLALLIAAGIPDLTDQEAAGFGPPPAERPTWPWSAEAFRLRVAEAEGLLAERQGAWPGKTGAGQGVRGREAS